MNNTLIERLLEHFWLQARLSQNTLQAYRHDLEKIAARLALNHLDWLSAQNTDLAAAIYHPDEQPRSQARALSACKRLYGWLSDTEQRADNPTERLHASHPPQNLPKLITEAQIDALLAAPAITTAAAPTQVTGSTSPTRKTTA